MKHIFTSILALGLLSSLPASALEISVTPGDLKSKYADLTNTLDNTLKLTGSADVRDLALLKNMSASIKTLDLSSLDIAAYDYPSGESYMGKASFMGGEIPPYIMTGSHITSIILPEKLSKIGESAFVASCIESVDFPSKLQEIGNYAFANADNLKKVVLHNSAKLGIGVFKDCDALKDVIFEYDVKEIPDSFFDGCVSFSSDIPSSVKTIGAFAYRGTAGDLIDLTNVSSVGEYAFADMKNLEEIIIVQNSDLSLGKGAFFNDGALEMLPSFTTDMQQSVFSHTSGIINGVIYSKTIGAGAYANNESIDSVFFGSNVEEIGPHAFRNARNLELVDVSAKKGDVIKVDKDAFSGCEDENGEYKHINLNVEDGMAENWENDPVWSLFNIGHFDTGVEDIIADASVDIKIRKAGNGVEVVSSRPLDYIGIFSVSGITLYEAKPGVAEVTVGGINPADDVIVVKVISSGISKIAKLK